MLFIFFLNIVFPFVILMSQNYIWRNRQYHVMVFEKNLRYWEQKLTILLMSCTKRLCMHNWDTILENRGRLDKTAYGEGSVKVSG